MMRKYVKIFDLLGEKLYIKDSEGLAKNLKDQRCLVIGDSYERGTGGVVGHGVGYYFQKSTGCILTSYQNSRGGFVATGGGSSDFPGLTFGEILIQELPKIDEDIRKEFKWCIFVGGYNDGFDEFYDSGKIQENIDTAIFTVKQYLPYANIAIIPLYNADAFDSNNRINAYKLWSSSATRNGCLTSTTSIFWFTNVNDCDAGDGIHLNDRGYQRAGNLVASTILGYQNAYDLALNGSWDGELNLSTGVTIDNEHRFRIYYNNGIAHMFGALRVSDIEDEMVLFTMPSLLTPWGNNIIPCVIQQGEKYVNSCVSIDYNDCQLKGGVGDLSGEVLVWIYYTYPIRM